MNYDHFVVLQIYQTSEHTQKISKARKSLILCLIKKIGIIFNCESVRKSAIIFLIRGKPGELWPFSCLPLSRKDEDSNWQSLQIATNQIQCFPEVLESHQKNSLSCYPLRKSSYTGPPAEIPMNPILLSPEIRYKISH